MRRRDRRDRARARGSEFNFREIIIKRPTFFNPLFRALPSPGIILGGGGRGIKGNLFGKERCVLYGYAIQ
jgi:hypothetical protein